MLKKQNILHTCSSETRFLENEFKKTTVARVQSVLAIGVLTAVLNVFSVEAVLEPFGPPGVHFFLFGFS